jgi:hypothetical protein
MHPGLGRGHDRLRHCGLSCLLGTAVLHRFYGGLPRPAVLGSNARASEEIVMEEKTESAGTLVLGCKRAKMHLICQLRGITDVQAPSGRRDPRGE